jgi:hypothetical protein
MLCILNASIVSAAAMVKEREAGTLEQLMMSPAGTYTIVVAKIVPLFLLLCLMVLGAISLMKLVFQVPFRGGYVLVMLGAALCVLCGIGIGTFIATFTKTSAQAQLTSFFVNPTADELVRRTHSRAGAAGVVAAGDESEPDLPFRRHRARQHAPRQRTRHAMAQFSRAARVYARSGFVERVALPETTQLERDKIYDQTCGRYHSDARAGRHTSVCERRVGSSWRRARRPTCRTNSRLSGRTAQNGGVTATESPVPGTTTSVNTINPTLQVSGSFAGSAGSPATLPFSGKLSLREAVERGLQYNLGAVGMAQAVRQARGQQLVARSSLLPNLNGALREYDEKLSLKAQGLGSIPGLGASLPAVIGPFHYFDLRATLTQTVADMTALNNYRSSKEIVRANVFAAEDARDLVVFAVGGAYLQTIAAAARVESVRAQLETATALYRQNAEKRGVGLLAQTDVNRSQVQALTQQQRLISLQNDLAKQKINLARLVGLPASDRYALSEDIPFSAAPWRSSWRRRSNRP